MRRAVFLDRDGVLNRIILRNGKPHSPWTLAEVDVLPGVPEATAALRKAGYCLIMITNQPDVSRGFVTRDTVEAQNRMLTAELGLDAVYVCWHDNADACACRKPQPGLLLQAAADLDVDLRASYMVGDRWRDIEAGRRAGCTTIQVEDCYGEQSDVVPDKRVRSLKEAAEWIVARDGCR